MSPKIVLLGAGSASFGLVTVSTLIRSKVLNGSEIVLVDLDEELLELTEMLANKLRRSWEADMTIVAETDRRRVLRGADFIIASIEVPPREKLWRLDWEIPLKHGLRQPYGENGGPGGLMHTCRQIPPFLEIVNDMEQLCPDAWLINFSNPLPRIQRAVTRESQIKVIGKCHQIDVGYAIATALLADHLGIRDVDITQLSLHSDPANSRYVKLVANIGRSRLKIRAGGLNHFTWILEIHDRMTGQDLYPALRRAARHIPDDFEPFSMELFRLFDYCPVPGDSHLAEYLPWAHDSVAQPWKTYNIHLYDWDSSIQRRSMGREAIMNILTGDSDCERLRKIPGEGAAELVEAITYEHNYYDEAVNLTNRDAIANLPDETIVEVPALVSNREIRAVSLGSLPEPIAELCRREAALVELVVQAAVSGDRRAALQALLLDPMINDIQRAKSILDDYLRTFGDYLPQF